MTIEVVGDLLGRIIRTSHAAIKVAREHGPRWLAIAIPIALIIPGPQDELIILLLIAWCWWRRPLMRIEMKGRCREAWYIA
jgi:hypothetical protein